MTPDYRQRYGSSYVELPEPPFDSVLRLMEVYRAAREKGVPAEQARYLVYQGVMFAHQAIERKIPFHTPSQWRYLSKLEVPQ